MAVVSVALWCRRREKRGGADRSWRVLPICPCPPSATMHWVLCMARRHSLQAGQRIITRAASWCLRYKAVELDPANS